MDKIMKSYDKCRKNSNIIEKIVKKVQETKYVDLKTGKLYNKNKDGELIEIKEKAEEKEVKYE